MDGAQILPKRKSGTIRGSSFEQHWRPIQLELKPEADTSSIEGHALIYGRDGGLSEASDSSVLATRCS